MVSSRFAETHILHNLAQLYDDTITAVPLHTVRCRRRPSDPWFDAECRHAKRRVRRFERAARSATPADAAAAHALWIAERRIYRDLRRQKRESFWTEKVRSEKSCPHELWRSVNDLMGRGSTPASSTIAAGDFHRFMDDKVAGVRASTDRAPPPQYTTAPSDCSLHHFTQLTTDDVVAAVRQLPDKQSATDPIPTRLLKEHVDVLLPFLTALFNRSLSLGVVPSGFKTAYITPRLKKPDLDPADVKSFRPISNLTVLSKLLERLVARQLLDHVSVYKLLPDFQSAYRAQHSTETAVLKVLSDILTAADRGDLSMLTLLDLSAAFDTVDHPILLRRLKISYGFNGVVHMWISSYLANRTQYVLCPGSRSTPLLVLCGVPQGSVLGPLLFLLYTADKYTWWSTLNCIHICMPTTPRSMGPVDRAPLTVYGLVLLIAVRCRRRLDAFQSTSTKRIQDGSTVVRLSSSTKSATFRSASRRI